MNISAIGQANGSSEQNNSRSIERELGREAFLQILVSQLANQDPLNPVEDQDFIAQLAQFSVLEQVQSINEGFSFSQALSLVGKSVYATYTAENGRPETLFGRVDLALMRKGQPWLEINGIQIPLDQNIVVYDEDILASKDAPENETE